MSHLFIEGPIRTGKSSLIRTCLKPYIQSVGGFSCQRMLSDTGTIVGYRLAPPSDLRVTVRFQSHLDNIFMFHKEHGTEKKLEVFEDAGVSYLNDIGNKKLLLLDEIGGFELLSPEFCRVLCQRLHESIPCIGVLKLESAVKSQKVKALNRQLRQDLQENENVTLLKFNCNSQDVQLQTVITDWLSSL